MIRRPNAATPPPELMSFPGWPEYVDAGLWERDFEAWHRRRDAWLPSVG
jgi:hypothetical protein